MIILRIGEPFTAAEVNELVALHGALPVLAYPRKFTVRCAEGIRSTVGDVLQPLFAIIYPAEYLEEAAWNQLVLKAFTEKEIDRIGLDKKGQ